MAIGWMTDLAEANDYFINKRLETNAWDGLANDATKTKALWNGYNRINNSPKFSISTSPSPGQLAKLKDAQCEMAYYLAVHLADEDRRKGLQAQGVASAGIVQESYSADKLNEIPFPPIVLELLNDFKTEKPFFAIDIDRDEDESVDEDVVD